METELVPFRAHTKMETEATTMASGSSSLLRSEACCTACGIHKYWTPRMWECDVCRDYFLCEDCYKGSLDDPELLSDPPKMHHQDHHMSPHVIIARCDGCGSSPIGNLRWRCKVCSDIDLCEACHRRLAAVDLPREHSKEHPMIAIEVLCTDMLLKFQRSFSKLVDPKWSFKVEGDTSSSGFMWAKQKPMPGVLSGMEGTFIHTLSNVLEDSSHPILKMEGRMNKSSFFKQALETSQTNRIFDKKHKIFLSHAGVDKDFVEQLHRDLSRVHHFGVFFDKEDGSLPKGEPFPKKIFDAAKHCELAVVVISRDYFLRKWPMLELTTFVEAQKVQPELKILPVFYKLSVEEFKKQQHSFIRNWTKMRLVSKDEMQGWKEALKVISRTNGLEYDKKLGEVALRDRIVETVYKHVKPELMWDDSHVQGKPRMQQLIEEKMQMSRIASGEVLSTSTLRIGLFGMGGSGKTTMCKVFRNQMTPHYLGKVCHIEFGGVGMLHLRMKLLQSICQLDSSLLQALDEGEALILLKAHIPKQKMCLIIDNVSDNQSSIEEARTLLNLPFEAGSLILVTSRSSIILENLKIAKRLTMRIPSLTKEEARALFCHHTGCDTSSLTEEQKKVMENFVERCNFKVKGCTLQEYHPLALKVLGTRVGSNAPVWHKVRIDFPYHENENEDPIFSILRSSFDALSLKYQRIFLDIALCYSTDCHIHLGMVGLEWQMRCLYGKTDKRFISQVVEVLQAKSLVEFYDVKTRGIYVHDLYVEFARMEVEKKGLQHSPRCCFSCGSKGHDAIQERRVRIHDHSVSHITKDILSCTVCSETELLSIQDCANLVSVDVQGMRNLRMFYVIRGCPKLTSVKLEGAVNLKDLTWDDFVGEYPDLTSLESLERLCLKNDEAQSRATVHGCLDFSRSFNLEVLYLSCLPLNLLNLNQVVLLKQLCFVNCQHFKRFEGLVALIQLEILVLKACSSLVEFPSLANFPSLEMFFLKGAGKLKAILGFANLTALRQLSLNGGKELEELPGIEACTRLSHLNLCGTSIGDCSWISAMEDLTFIDLRGTNIRFVPCCGSLCKLSELWLDECQALESIGNSRVTSTFPKSLGTFSARKCRSLNAVPQFHHESALEHLDICGTCVEDVSGVTCCKQLQKLFLGKTRITSLPDLSSLTRLEWLDVHECELLIRMDNITSLPALEALYVFGCTRLLALPDLRSSTGLTNLNLSECPLLNPNSVMLPCGSTIDLEVEITIDLEVEITSVDDHSDHSEITSVDDHSDHSEQASENPTSGITNFQEPDLDLWRFASYILLAGQLASWCGHHGAD